MQAQRGRATSNGVYLRDIPHVDAASPCATTCPVSQGSGGGVFVNDNEEQRAIEHRSIEQRSKPGSSNRRIKVPPLQRAGWRQSRQSRRINTNCSLYCASLAPRSRSTGTV
jgi:hypothetical protein